ncbi:YdcF family protein [Oceanobacillus sp. HCA-5259]|uniref:YdcF family protein n=1 Tax=Oceanobacillus sp. HCA-5259 TaxID=3134661 RepID=UPI0030C59673
MLVIFLIVISIIIFVLFFAAKLLIVNDDISQVDNTAIILLMGSIADRSLGAAELYEKGKINKIIMAASYSPGFNLLKERNVSIEGIAERSKMVLEELGVDKQDIEILQGNTKNTKDEALLFREYIKTTNKIDKIIIVTSKYHSFRSKLIFNHVLRGLQLKIFSVPTPYDPFHYKGWYRNRLNSKLVLTEYIKLFYFIIVESIQIKRNEL